MLTDSERFANSGGLGCNRPPPPASERSADSGLIAAEQGVLLIPVLWRPWITGRFANSGGLSCKRHQLLSVTLIPARSLPSRVSC